MRSQALVLLLISLFFVKFAQSQSDELLIQGQTGKLYLEHTVVAKENWYSIGRLYNISPKEIAPFNKLTMAQPLTIGEHLSIPLTAVNFSQNGLKSAGETLVPLYHIIQEKEWMYRISVNHNKVPISSLEKWNNINKDQVRAGMHLIVGYLKVKTALSALATNGAGPAVSATAPSGAAEQGGSPAASTEAPVSGSRTGASTPASQRAASTTTPATGGRTGASAASAAGSQTPASTAGSKTSASATGTRTTTPPVNKPPVITATVATTSSTAKDTGIAGKGSGIAGDIKSATHAAPVVTHAPSATTSPVTTTTPAATTAKATPPATAGTPVSTTTTMATKTMATPAAHFDGGYFKPDFVDGGKSANGSAGVFKSTSGWQDGKYYALMNNVAVGTIVKINVPSTGKSVYAKILGQLPDMKESAGLAIRISNAAASELGEGEGRFNAEVRY